MWVGQREKLARKSTGLKFVVAKSRSSCPLNIYRTDKTLPRRSSFSELHVPTSLPTPGTFLVPLQLLWVILLLLEQPADILPACALGPHLLLRPPPRAALSLCRCWSSLARCFWPVHSNWSMPTPYSLSENLKDAAAVDFPHFQIT